MKGKLEDAVKSLGFAKLSIFNPPILERKNTDRTGEVIGLKVIRFLNSSDFSVLKNPCRRDTCTSPDKFREVEKTASTFTKLMPFGSALTIGISSFVSLFIVRKR
jgi:hypothetical protein